MKVYNQSVTLQRLRAVSMMKTIRKTLNQQMKIKVYDSPEVEHLKKLSEEIRSDTTTDESMKSNTSYCATTATASHMSETSDGGGSSGRTSQKPIFSKL